MPFYLPPEITAEEITIMNEAVKEEHKDFVTDSDLSEREQEYKNHKAKHLPVFMKALEQEKERQLSKMVCKLKGMSPPESDEEDRQRLKILN